MRAAFPLADNHPDLGALAIVVPIVLLVTILAVYVPARRASGANQCSR